jgi:NAD(P)H-dependent FMN reductase
MITIICATHRPKNQTQKIVDRYEKILKDLHQEVKVFYLSELPENFVVADSFGQRTEETNKLIEQKLLPAERLVIISPEYNGSYPGVFKAFLDGVKPHIWKGKKAALVGVASGRAGNLRGMDHLGDVLHHLRVEVFSQKIPISQLETLLDERGELTDNATVRILEEQAREFLKF